MCGRMHVGLGVFPWCVLTVLCFRKACDIPLQEKQSELLRRCVLSC